MRKGGNAEADALGKEWGSLDVRWLGNTRYGLESDGGHVSQARMWIRLRDGLGDDPIVHTAAFTYASDVSLLGATLAAHGGNPATDPDGLARPHDLVPPARSAPTAGGSTTSGRPPPRAPAAWPSAGSSPQDGTLVATVAQEGLIRQRVDGYEGPGQA